MEYLVSVFPIVLLFVLMLVFKVPGNKSAFISLIVTIVLGLLLTPALGILPESMTKSSIYGVVGWSVVEGVLKAMFPILLIIYMAIYSYNIVVETKQIDVIKSQFVSLTDDKSILVLLMTWGFGGLLEGMAGFGTAVAIPAAILIGLGFKPFFSALAALLGNTVATAFGACGVPVTTLCNEASSGGHATVEMIHEISGFTILQLTPLFFLVPFAIVMLTDRKNVVKNVLLSLWVGGISWVVQLICAFYLGAETPAIVGSIAAILACVAAARVIKNKESKKSGITIKRALKAWSVYLSILVLILVSGAICPPVNSFLKSHLVSEIDIPVIGSHFKFGWLSNTALMLLIGSIVGGMIQGMTLKELIRLLIKTVGSLNKTTVTILSLITLASVMNYTGMIAAIASGLVMITGGAYPLFAPLVGAIGTFVTGSDTSSNILFAKLQSTMAHNLGLDGVKNYFGVTGNESNWLLSANTTGATGGKMISPQSIAIATAACDMKDSDDKLLKSAIPYALIYVLIGGLIVYFG